MKSVTVGQMTRFTNALDDMRTVSRKAATSNPVWVCACADRAANAIQELLDLVASLEASGDDLVAQLQARPYKTGKAPTT